MTSRKEVGPPADAPRITPAGVGRRKSEDELVVRIVKKMKIAQYGKYVDQIEMTPSKELEYQRMACAAIKEITNA